MVVRRLSIWVLAGTSFRLPADAASYLTYSLQNGFTLAKQSIRVRSYGKSPWLELTFLLGQLQKRIGIHHILHFDRSPSSTFSCTPHPALERLYISNIFTKPFSMLQRSQFDMHRFDMIYAGQPLIDQTTRRYQAIPTIHPALDDPILYHCFFPNCPAVH